MRWIPGRAPLGTCKFIVFASWLSLDLHVGVGVSLRVCSVLLQHLSVGLLLGDCFCDIITCHYCFFCVYYFNVVHVFCVMRKSPNCDILLYNNMENNLFNTVKIEKLEYKTLYRVCRYVKMKFENNHSHKKQIVWKHGPS